MFEIVVQHHFSAAHALRGYPGKCRNTHGHNFKVQVTIEGETLNEIGILVDFKDVKAAMQEIIDELDHQFLNELPAFQKVNPSSEAICRFFHDELALKLEGLPSGSPLKLKEVRMAETDGYTAAYRP